MTNNFEIIKPLLDWKNSDQFYFVQVLQRKKDTVPGMKVNGANNNSRLIKAYYVNSLEYLDFITPEIIQLCEIFNARAGINLNIRSYEKVALQHLKLVTDNLINKNYDKIYKSYSSAVGKFSNDATKKWIVDIDESEVTFIEEIKKAVNLCDPEGTKIIAEIPSKTGVHLITTAFNRVKFPIILNELMEKYQVTLKLDIQSNNPTNCYIP